MVKAPSPMFWLYAAALAQGVCSQSGSNETWVQSTGTPSSSVAEAIQAHTISVGKVGVEFIAIHHTSMKIQEQLFLTNARPIVINIIQTPYKQTWAILLVSHL